MSFSKELTDWQVRVVEATKTHFKLTNRFVSEMHVMTVGAFLPPNLDVLVPPQNKTPFGKHTGDPSTDQWELVFPTHYDPDRLLGLLLVADPENAPMLDLALQQRGGTREGARQVLEWYCRAMGIDPKDVLSYEMSLLARLSNALAVVTLHDTWQAWESSDEDIANALTNPEYRPSTSKNRFESIYSLLETSSDARAWVTPYHRNAKGKVAYFDESFVMDNPVGRLAGFIREPPPGLLI